MSKLCLKCQKNIVPATIIIDGKTRNLCNRKYCLTCSPFKRHNTKQLHCESVNGQSLSKDYKDMNKEERKQYNIKIYNYQRTKRWALKKKLVLLKGGKCQKCGYDKNLAVLSFHHLDPYSKDFCIDARSLISKSYEIILSEVEKCQLLCMNCHQEIHYPQHFQWKNDKNIELQ